LFKEVPESNRLIEIMFGYHPKASAEYGIADPMHWELISKMPWAGLGTPRKHPKFRHMDGSVFNARFTLTIGWWSIVMACSIARCCIILRCSKRLLSSAILIKCSRRCRTKRTVSEQFGK
jgi:hypothetical protein